MNFFLEPFQYPFMRTGLAAVTLAGALCGALGAYVVLRRAAAVGHALTHSALPGLALAHRYGWSPGLGAVAANLVTALGIGWMTRREDVHEDTAVGVLSGAMFAAGVLIMAASGSARDLSAMLFGQVLGVTRTDVLWMLAAAAAVAAALALFHKEWLLSSLDPGHARLIGLPVGALRVGYLVLLVIGVAATVQTVGAALAGALLVAPAAAARLLARRLPGMMLLSSVLGAASGAGGLLLSYHTSLPSGAAIVLLCAGVYAAVRAATAAREAWGRATPLRRLLGAAVLLNGAVIAVEALGGWRADSLALLLDVAHNLADQTGLILLFVAHGKGPAPSPRLRRAAMVASAGGLALLLVLLAGAALGRSSHPGAVRGGLTMLCGLLAVAGNAGVAGLLRAPARSDAALRLVHIHNVGDAFVSLVPVAAGALVAATGRSGWDALLAGAAALILSPAAVRSLRSAWRDAHD